MEHERSIETFSIETPRGHAYRLLGIRSKGRRPRESVVQMFEEEYELASRMIEGRAVMRISHGGLPGSSHLDPAMPLVVAVCTIGPALEHRVSELADSGDAARALILDAIGSAAAEEAADQSNRLICEMAAPTDFSPDRRRSPGYGKWDIREQKAIFSYLNPEDIGVTLSPSCMMTPRKSISYVVPLEGGKPGAGAGRRCSRCGLEDCPYRATGEESDEMDWMKEEGDRES
jgi:hypothetical protein